MTEAVATAEKATTEQAPTLSKRGARILRRKLGVANITVVGVGGSGCNTVARLMEEKPVGINFVCANTDIRALQSLRGDGLIVLPIGEAITKGFGAGGNAQVGEQAALAGRAALKQVLSGSDVVFITTGMGGGTGTGAAPVVAEIAKKVGALAVALVTLPFAWEGHRRMENALSGLSKLKSKVDNMILVHNDLISSLVSKNTPMQEAFKRVDDVVTEGILVVNEIVNTPGDINVDLADVRAILALPGNALMSIGEGSGIDAAQEAAEKAVKNPLLDLSIAGAKGALFTVKGGPRLTVNQVNAAGRMISKALDPDAMIFFGMSIRPDMESRVRITIIATGIPDHEKARQAIPPAPAAA